MKTNKQETDPRKKHKNIAFQILNMYSQHKWRSFGLMCSFFCLFIGTYGLLNPDGYKELFFTLGHPDEPYLFIVAFVMLFPLFSVLLFKHHLSSNKK